MSDSTTPENGPERAIPPANALIGRERIRGASRMIPEGTDAKDVTEEQIRDVVNDVDTLLRTCGSGPEKLTREKVARAIGYSPGVVVEFLKGTYRGNRGKVAIDLDAWLIEEEQRRLRPQTTQFVWTNVAQEIRSVASYCLDYRKIGLLYGPDASGVGKTISLQAIHQELGPRRCSLVTIDKVDANPSGVLRKICVALRKNDSGSNRRRFETIVEELRGRSHLLLVDQIHNLRGAKEDKPFYILTDLYDATNTAQLWCGTADLVAYLNTEKKRSQDESLAQIRRRIFPCVDLMESLRAGGSGGGGELLVTVDQVREMFAKNKLKITTAAARFLCEISNLPDSGAVGLCVQVVEYATMMAEMRRLPSIDVPLLQEALRRGFTPKRAAVLLRDLHVETAPRAAKVG